MNKKEKVFPFIFSILLFFVVWGIISKIIDAPLILPSPFVVLHSLTLLLPSPEFWLSLSFTFLRVLLAFFISTLLGTLLGFFSSESAFVKNFLYFPLSAMRAVPVIAVILLALFWFHSGSVPVFVAVLMALPVMVTAAEKGFMRTDEVTQRIFMAECACQGRVWVLRYIRLPAARGFLRGGCQSVFGMCWKVVAAGEVLSLPKKGIGSLMQHSQVHLETADMLALTVMLVTVSSLFEKLIFCRKDNQTN